MLHLNLKIVFDRKKERYITSKGCLFLNGLELMNWIQKRLLSDYAFIVATMDQ